MGNKNKTRPMDAAWVENFNSVFDDNRILCLSNGQRIKVPLNIKMFFEASNINNISPATVTRLGIIYLN
jgi:dynein heavy chain